MKAILKQIIDNSYWELPIFDAAIIIRGRILSPTEAEQAGIIQFMVAASLIDQSDTVSNMSSLKDFDADNATADQIADLMKTAKSLNINPNHIARINEHNDSIIKTVVKEASIDDGKTFEPFEIVLGADQQSADDNKLWIGMLSKADRDLILEKAMESFDASNKKIKKLFQKKTA